MILATHALVGAAIGDSIDNPWLIIVLSLVLHFILDTFRHGDYVNKKLKVKEVFWKFLSIDIFPPFLIIIIYIFLRHPDPITLQNILIGVIASILPDVLTFINWIFKLDFLNSYYKFHSNLHRYPTDSPERAWTLRNAANDIIFSLIAIIILFLK